ncbi:PQQ-dependent sugar dehydrogenase [Chitinophaga lutea]
MKKIAVLVLLAVCVGAAVYYFFLRPSKSFTPAMEAVLELDGGTKVGITTIASGLNVPWELAWGPDGQVWYTEQSGTISKVDPATGDIKLLLHIPEVYRKRSLGLLGMAIHPKEPYVFVDYTHMRADSTIVSRLMRYTYSKDTLLEPKLLFELPGASGHNGSRVAIAPDGTVLLATGDAARGTNAPDTASPNGKVLRFNVDGSIPKDNPYPGNPMWSRGHRNIQGLAHTDKGVLFASEHGDALDDEVNRIEKAGFYGWPHVEGFADRDDEKAYADTFPFTNPLKAWTPTIAPAGIEFYDGKKIPEWKNTILLTTLKTASLRVLHLNGAQDSITVEDIYLSYVFGRIRDICVSPDGDIYLSTSNRDWNPGKGFPLPTDDRILRLSPVKGDVAAPRLLHRDTIAAPGAKGAVLYKSYCEACHKADGQGVKGSFPALDKNIVVTGDAKTFIQTILQGKASKTGEAMPAFGFLSDEDVAEIATYTRTAWSNKAGIVTDIEVRKARKK